MSDGGLKDCTLTVRGLVSQAEVDRTEGEIEEAAAKALVARQQAAAAMKAVVAAAAAMAATRQAAEVSAFLVEGMPESRRKYDGIYYQVGEHGGFPRYESIKRGHHHERTGPATWTASVSCTEPESSKEPESSQEPEPGQERKPWSLQGRASGRRGAFRVPDLQPRIRRLHVRRKLAES